MGTIILLADGAIRVTNLGAASTADIGERALSKGLIKSKEQLAECSSHTGAGGAIRCLKLKPALHVFYTVFFLLRMKNAHYVSVRKQRKQDF
jgi:hypothetical protein